MSPSPWIDHDVGPATLSGERSHEKRPDSFAHIRLQKPPRATFKATGVARLSDIALPLDGATTLESHATPAHDQSTTTFPWHCGPNPSGIGTTARCMPIRVVGQRTGGIARAAPVFVPRRPIRTRRLLKVLLECRQLSPTGAEVWRRITAWTRFNEAGAEAALTAYASGVTSTQTTIAG